MNIDRIDEISITGDILEYHFLRQHATFGSHRSFMTDIRNNILQNLRLWERTLQEQVTRNSSSAISNEESKEVSTTPNARRPGYNNYSKVVLYGRHIWDCQHVLLFGTMDFVGMYKDLSWQASADFVQAGEHAMSCAKVDFLTILPRSLLTKPTACRIHSEHRSSSSLHIPILRYLSSPVLFHIPDPGQEAETSS